MLAEKANIQHGEKVLDAGCGVGGSAFWLAKNRGAHVTGITLSERQFAKAKELSARLGLEKQTEFSLQDFTKTNFPDGTFDVVWAIESVCYALDKSIFLKEAYRVLKPGGHIIVGDGFLERLPQNEKEVTMLKNFLKGWALDNLAESKNFEHILKIAGFRNIQDWDMTEAILPTAVFMARLCQWAWPVAVFTAWLHLTPRLLADNNRAGINQFDLFKQRVFTWRIFLAEK